MTDRTSLTGKSQAMQHLDVLTNEIGPRLPGSRALDEATRWAAEQFQAFGLSNVSTEPAGTVAVGFERGPYWGRMHVNGDAEVLSFATPAWSAGTRGVQRAVVRASSKGEGADVDGAWVLVTHIPDEDTLRALAEDGAIGVIARPRSERIMVGGNARVTWANRQQLPIIVVDPAQHARLVAALERALPVELEIEVRNYYRRGPFPLENVVAEIPGTDGSGAHVLLGAHLDSWDGGTGATDDGVGCALVLDVARVLAATGAQPRRTLRFVLFSGEEIGLLGSRAYAARHATGERPVSAAFVVDGGQNPVTGVDAPARWAAHLAPLERAARAEGLAFEVRTTPEASDAPDPNACCGGQGGTDINPFVEADIPAFLFRQEGPADYRETHHTTRDTYDVVDPSHAPRSVAVIAEVLLAAADIDWTPSAQPAARAVATPVGAGDCGCG